MGTVKWHDCSLLTDEEDGPETNFVAAATHRFFLGKK
jgi:hypothetical protein